jgi:hypothetical protein
MTISSQCARVPSVCPKCAPAHGKSPHSCVPVCPTLKGAQGTHREPVLGLMENRLRCAPFRSAS